MPKVKLVKPTEAERLTAVSKETAKLIRQYMIEREIKYDMEMADMIEMNRGTFSSKMKEGTWTQRDLCRIVKALRIPADEALRMLGMSA